MRLTASALFACLLAACSQDPQDPPAQDPPAQDPPAQVAPPAASAPAEDDHHDGPSLAEGQGTSENAPADDGPADPEFPDGVEPRATLVRMIGAGDIASCASSGDEATANLLDGMYGTVFTAGDNAYDSGTAAEFRDCYGPSWGRHKSRTRPSPGNHDYKTSGASAYFDYFANDGPEGRGYYWYKKGGWLILSLNSNCSIVGCDEDSAQVAWLKAVLEANPTTCAMAYFHHPRYSSGSHGNHTMMTPIWEVLYEHGVDVVVSGHDHHYERFAKQDPWGNRDDTTGIREFVVGTGGKSLYGLGEIQPNSLARSTASHGVLRLTLYPDKYYFKYVPTSGSFTDQGYRDCH